MRILGIDFGKRKVGLAFADSSVADPLIVLKFKNRTDLLKKLKKVIKEKDIQEIVIGISEGKMAELQKAFGMDLSIETGLPVFLQDETLTTQEAQLLSIAAGKKRKKRAEMEDAYSAALILQKWLAENL